MILSLIASIDLDNAIGANNRLLYHLPDDMARFKQLTTGHTVIMGRRTFESLPNGPLPNRRNIIVSKSLYSKNGMASVPGALVCPSLPDALNECIFQKEVFIIGGESIYHDTINFADRLYITLVNAHTPNADAFFPKIDRRRWVEVSREVHPADDRHKQAFSFINYVRKGLKNKQ